MPIFKATVCRTSYGFATITVVADTKEEAEQKIREEEGDHEYSEKSSEYSIENGIQCISPMLKQRIEFNYEGKDFIFEFQPEEEDWWTAFKQHDIEFDVHYLEDEDDQICVYRVVNNITQTDKTIHTQKIKK